MRDRRLMLSDGLILPVPPRPRPPALSAASPVFLTFVSIIVGAIAVANLWAPAPDLHTNAAAPLSREDSKKIDDLRGDFDRRVPVLEDHDTAQQKEIEQIRMQTDIGAKTLDRVVMILNILYVIAGLFGSILTGVFGQMIYTWWQERRKVKHGDSTAAA